MRTTEHRLAALASRTLAVFVLMAVCVCSFAAIVSTAMAQNSDSVQASNAGTAYVVFNGTDTITFTPTQPQEGATCWTIENQTVYTKDNLPKWCQGEYPSKI